MLVNPSLVSAEARARMRQWRAEPWTFVRQAFGVIPDAWQDEYLHALPGHMRLALKACKGPGKSAVMAWTGWWFLLTRPFPKIVCTSISGDNLHDGLWAEFAKWQKASPLLKSSFTWTSSRIFANDHAETWWASARTWPKSADSSQQADTLAGIHGDHVLFLVDEAGGIPDAVVAAAEAGLANADPEKGTEAKLILAGNPTHLEGPLYRACTREAGLWWVKSISSAPNDPNRTPRVTKEWAQQQIDKYGADSPWVLVNVFGQFPPGQSNALLGVEEVTAATKRELMESEFRDEVKMLGVDVARFGDDRTIILLRQGRALFRPKVFRNIDTMRTASEVARVIEAQEPDATFVDQTGVGGGVVDRLRQLGFSVIGVDSGSKADAPNKFRNKRCEMWWGMADWVRAGGCLPDDPDFISELTAPTYHFDANGRFVLESKDDIKARGMPSPDKADALCLTFAQPVASKSMRYRSMPTPKAIHNYEPYRSHDSDDRAVTEYDPYRR